MSVGANKFTITFGGEPFEVDLKEKTLKFHLREPMQAAGSTFKWPTLYGQQGVGLNIDALSYAKKNGLKILIEWLGDTEHIYQASADGWIQFALKTKSELHVRSAVIMVLPFTSPFFSKYMEAAQGTQQLSQFF